MSFDPENAIVDAREADDKWNKSINWENLRSIGSSPLASVSILMPFIGYTILYNEQIMTILLDLGIVLGNGAALITQDGASNPTDILSAMTKLF